MNLESPQRKPPSPRASTEVSSLQKNKSRNSEALERRLLCRRPVKELINQGIMLSPTIGNALKVKELQRAKTADILKRKIERRPDKQMLINQRILKVSDTGASPLIQEKCNALIRNQLCESLNSKLEQRLGSLELVEKGVLKVDPGVATLIRGGSIPYPRVASTSPSQLSTVPEESVDVEIVPPPPPPPPSAVSSKTSRTSKPRTPSRSLKDETVISRYGSLVFHNYRPSSAASSNSPSLRSTPATSSTLPNSGSTSVRLPKHRAREVQQAELLHLEDAVQVHRRLSQEICQLGGVPPHKVAQTASNHHQEPGTQPQVFQQVLLSQPQPRQSATCYILQQNPVSTPQPQPTPVQPAANGLFLTTQHIFDNVGAGVVTLSNNPIGTIEAGVTVQQTAVTPVPSTATVAPPPPSSSPPPPPLTPALKVASSPISSKTAANNGAVESSEPPSTHKVAALAEIEAVLLDVRRIRDEIDQELYRIDSSHPVGSNTDWHLINELIKRHDNACSLARLLISDRLEYLDEITPQQSGGGDDPQKLHSGLELERKFLVGRLERLRGNSVTLIQQRQQQQHNVPQPQPWFSPFVQEADGAHFPSDANGVVQQQHRRAPLVWRNSTILPANESENLLYNQQQRQQGVPVQPISCQAGELRTNGSLVELPSTWMEPVYDAMPFQSSVSPPPPPNFASMNQHVNGTTIGMQQLNNGNGSIGASATAMHTTASMPANLHLINNSGLSMADPSAASMLLTPNLDNDDFGHGISSAACAFLDGGGGVAGGGGGGGGSSGNSAAFATTNTTATTESSVGSINGTDGDLVLMMDIRKPSQAFDDVQMGISPSYLYGIPSPPRSHNHEPSDVQDFLSNFGDVPMSSTKHRANANGVDGPSMTEDQMGLVLDYDNSNGYSENGGVAYSGVSKAPPGPQFFASPPGEEEGDSDMLWSAGMDFS